MGANFVLQINIKQLDMKTIELKTNIMCSACIAKVTPTLNGVIGENEWRVDTQNSKKVLSVTSESLSEEEIISAVEKAGYKAERLV
jgi:copper chaperone CopZ